MRFAVKGHAVSAGYTPTVQFLEHGGSSVSTKAGNLLTGLAIITFSCITLHYAVRACNMLRPDIRAGYWLCNPRFLLYLVLISLPFREQSPHRSG